MIVATSRAELSTALSGATGSERRALVPTMGALHSGHAFLLRRAQERADSVVVSIFVNPLQFAAGEDLNRYPRTLDTDLAMCADHGVAVVFAPGDDEVYPHGPPQVSVDPGPLATVLEGASRPGHFTGVLTVVSKLFGLVQPQVAVFGEKDYQQLVLVQQMVRDLCLPVEVVGVETVRSPEGLALSSRNRFLSEAEGASALALARALRDGAEAGDQGAAGILAAARRTLELAGEVELDYLSLRAPDLGPPPSAGAARLLVAARVGVTRLIDNVAVSVGGSDEVASS